MGTEGMYAPVNYSRFIQNKNKTKYAWAHYKGSGRRQGGYK